MSKRIIILGLDCLDPGLVFDRWRDRLPNLRNLMERGMRANLRSTDPPITVPAWTALTTGADPGTLGVYGFRNRKDYGYDSLVFADAGWVKKPRIWDRLGEKGLRSIVIGIPQTYPPRPVNGIMVSGFMTPSKDHPFVWPESFRGTLDRVTPDYMLDVEDFRGADPERVIEQVYTMTAARFRLLHHCIREEQWDFMMMVEIGPDRLQHRFWAYMDKNSPFHESGHKYADVILEYYETLDREIGCIMDMISEDTALMVVSDHGAKAFHGGFCINEWLIRGGWLKVRNYPGVPGPLRPDNIDWSGTRVWAEGGYYARISLNIAGREPQGIVRPEEKEGLLAGLQRSLCTVSEGSLTIENQVFRPGELYRETNNIAPDLMLYPGSLDYRAIGSIGHDRLFLRENDSGTDQANHDFHGVFILAGPGISPEKRDEINVCDVAGIVMAYMTND